MVDIETLRPYTWKTRWEAFCNANSDWPALSSVTDPIYALPIEVIDKLACARPAAGNRREQTSLIDNSEEKAERAFTSLCGEFGSDVVGVWNDSPIRYPLLDDRTQSITELVTPEMFDQLGWGRLTPEVLEQLGVTEPNRGYRANPPLNYGSCQLRLKSLERRVNKVSDQRLAYAGWLTFASTGVMYRHDLACLKSRNDNLGGILSWPFSVGSLHGMFIPNLSVQQLFTQLENSVANLLEDAVRFVSRWKLARLVTWDLPDPQGPLSGLPIGFLGRVLDPQRCATHVPDYLFLADDELAQTMSSGVAPPSIPTPPKEVMTGKNGKPSAYATGFRMWFVEQAARSRYGARRGLITRLVEAFCDMFELKDDRVKEIRQLYVHLFADQLR